MLSIYDYHLDSIKYLDASENGYSLQSVSTAANILADAPNLEILTIADGSNKSDFTDYYIDVVSTAG